MSLFFGSSRRDRLHLLDIVRQLGSTSLTGLSAALSWSPRRTDRVLREIVAEPGAPIAYDAARGTVVLASRKVKPSSPAPPVPEPAPAPAATPATVLLPRSWGGMGRCTVCSVPFVRTENGEALVCPKCGRLASGRSTTAPAAAPPAPSGASPRWNERRSQELFAAWVTASPIPCPKCRTTLRHHGIGEYACPSCGERVNFQPALPTTLAPPGEPPAAPPTLPAS